MSSDLSKFAPITIETGSKLARHPEYGDIALDFQPGNV